MFEETVYSYDILHTRMREEAFLNAGLRITHRRRRLASAEKQEQSAAIHVLRGRHPGVRHLSQPHQDAAARPR
ncbi:MAG: hypothetical protein ACLU38_02520 [Dysosmobacter sp.]